MNPDPDSRRHAESERAAERGSRAGSDPALPMDAERALLLLGQERDGRLLDVDLLAAAREHARRHPEVARAAAEMALISDVLAELPAAAPASADFTERVLAAWRRRRATPRQGVVRLGLGMAAAAALVLALVLVYDARRPEAALADPSVESQHFLSESFGADPYTRPDLEAGLRALLPGPLDLAGNAGEAAETRGAAEVGGAHGADDAGGAAEGGQAGEATDSGSPPSGQQPSDEQGR